MGSVRGAYNPEPSEGDSQDAGEKSKGKWASRAPTASQTGLGGPGGVASREKTNKCADVYF